MNTTELFNTISKAYVINDINSLKPLVKDKKIDFAASDSGVSLMDYLVASGYREVIEFLIATKANLEARDQDQKTFLHWAAQYGDLEITKLLIEKGIDINAQDHQQETALHRAVHGEYTEVALLLIAKGANLWLRYHDKSTFLHWAAQHGDLLIAQLLIKKGVDVDAKDDIDQTALHRAASYGHLAMIQLLIANEANVHNKDRLQYTALHWVACCDNIKLSACCDHRKIARLLIEKGAKVDDLNNKQQTPLDLVVQHPQPAMLACLLPYQEPDVITQACDTLVNNMQGFFPNTERISDKRLEGFKALMPYSMQCTLYFLENPEKNIDSLLEGNLQLRRKGLPQELIDLILEEIYSIPEKLTASVECLRCCEGVTSLPTPDSQAMQQVMKVIQNKIEAMKPKTRDELLTQTNDHSQEALPYTQSPVFQMP